MSKDPVKIDDYHVSKTATEIFTDRVEPRKAFWEKYDSLDVSEGKFDLIHFYGVGGIGKTTLLKKIRDELSDKGNNNVVLYSFENNTSKEKFLFSLARAVSIFYKTELRIFSYAYIRYLKNCKMSDDEITMRLKKDDSEDSSADTAGEVLKTVWTIGTDFVPILGNTMGRMGESLIDYVIGGIRKKKNTEFDEVEKRYIAEIDAAGEDNKDILAKLHVYLGHDLEKILPDSKVPLVLMLDGYEFINDVSKRSGGTEFDDMWLCGPAHSPGLVQSLQNVMWVVAGRERVKWSEDVMSDDDCHLLGGLSETDAAEYFKIARNPQGESMSDDLVASLYELTSGTPVYMDMCFKMFENGSGRCADDFGKDSREIAKRYLDNLDKSYRKTISFLACMPPVWTLEMVNGVSDILYASYVREYSAAVNDALSDIITHTYVEKMDFGFKLHQTIRDVVRDNIPKEEKEKIEKAVCTYLINVLSDDGRDIIERMDAVLKLGFFVSDYSGFSDDELWLFNSYVDILERRFSKFSEALSIRYKLYDEYVKRRGEDDLDAIVIHGNIAWTLYTLGQPLEAGRIEKDVYDRRVRLLGEDHPDTITALNNLALSIRSLGDLEETIRLQRLVYEKRLNIYGEEHPDTISAMNNLAVSLLDKGAYSEAAAMQEKAYLLQLKVLGEDHLMTVSAMGNYAYGLFELGKVSEAIELQEKVYQKYAQYYGEKHPATVTALNNLSDMIQETGEYEKALEMRTEVYKRFVELFGADHPDTLHALNNIACNYNALGINDEALRLVRLVYEKRLEVLGEDHPVTVTSMSNLGTMLFTMGEFEEAAMLQKKACEGFAKLVGEDYPEYISALNNYACALFRMGDKDKAIEVQSSVCEKRKKYFGEDHPSTRSAVNILNMMMRT